MFQLTTQFSGDPAPKTVTIFSERSARAEIADAIRTGCCIYARLVAFEKLGEAIREGRVIHTHGNF